MIRSFAENEVAPIAAEIDEEERFPVETVEKMGKIGIMGIPVPKEYGGQGGSNILYSMAVEELSRACATTGVVVSAHTSLCIAPILENGTEEQKKKYLPKLSSGEWIGAWGLTEPNTGSDAGNMKCTAAKKGDEWIINGTKSWITHGKSGNVAVLIARTGEPRAKNNATAFVIERGISLRWRRVVPPEIETAVQSCQSRADVPLLRRVCEQKPSALGRLLLEAANHLDWPKTENEAAE